MSKYLLKRTEKYRLDTEGEKDLFIEEQKAAQNEEGFELSKYSSQHKIKTQKGEVVDDYYLVTLDKVYNDEKLCGQM